MLALLGETVCPYCGVGCRLRVEGDDRGITRVRGVESAPANHGRLCAKGALLGPTVHTPDRAKYPLVRRSRTEPLAQVPWDEAIDIVAGKFRRVIAEHGPDAVAFYGSGQLDTEAAYLAVQAVQGRPRHQQHRLEQPAVHGRRRWPAIEASLGGDGPPTCYDDIDHADVHARHRLATWPRPTRSRSTGCAGQQEEPARAADHRRRPAADGDRADRRPAPAGRPRRRHRPPERPRPTARPERPGGRALHRLPHEGVRRVRAFLDGQPLDELIATLRASRGRTSRRRPGSSVRARRC